VRWTEISLSSVIELSLSSIIRENSRSMGETRPSPRPEATGSRLSRPYSCASLKLLSSFSSTTSFLSDPILAFSLPVVFFNFSIRPSVLLIMVLLMLLSTLLFELLLLLLVCPLPYLEEMSRKNRPNTDFREGAHAQAMATLHSAMLATNTLKATHDLSRSSACVRPK